MTSLGARFALRFGLTAAIAGVAALAVSLVLFAGRMSDVAREAHAGFDGVMTGQMERAGDFMAQELAARGRTALLDLDAGALTRIAQTATGGDLADAVIFYDVGGRAVADQGGPLPLDAAQPPRRLRDAAEGETVHWRDDSAFLTGRPVCVAGRCVGWVIVTLDAAPLLAEHAAIEQEIAVARGAFLADAAILGLGALALTTAAAALTGRRLGARAQGGATAVLRAIERLTATPRDVRARPRRAQLDDMKALAATLAEDAARGARPDATGEAALVADATGAIESATPALHALLRVAPPTLTGADAHVTFALGETDSAEALAQALGDLSETPTGDGETIPVLAATAIAGDGEARKVVCVVRSAERLARAEQAEAQRRFRVEVADRARDAFVDAMRDEIGAPRKPAADADGGTADAPPKRGLGAKLAALAAPASRAVDKALRLVRLRRTAEAQPADSVDPGALAAAVAEGVASATEFKRLALSVRVQPGAPIVLGDFEALRRIGAAFADNAVAATPSGEVVIDVAHRMIGDRAEIALTVQDSGPGLDAATLRRVKGMIEKPGDGGSGLAVAARLAKELGGAIDVGGAPGDGASFTLTFRAPIDVNAPPPAAAGGGASSADAGAGMAAMAPMALGAIGLPPLGPGEDDAATPQPEGDAEAEAAPLVMIPMAAAPIMGGDAADAGVPGPAEAAPAPVDADVGDAGENGAPPKLEAGPGAVLQSTTADAAREDTPDSVAAGTPEADDDAGAAAPAALDAIDRAPSASMAPLEAQDDAESAGADDAENGERDGDATDDALDDGIVPRHAGPPSAPDAGSAPIAIIAEGNQVDRIVLTTFLRKAGYACMTAATAAEVLDAARDGPALLMLGAEFAGADGTQLVETLRAREKASSTPPLVIYGLAPAGDEAMVEALRAAGVDDVIARPIRRDALEARLGARVERAAI